MEMGVYVHIPFCRSKCHYCDFTSYPGINEEEVTLYIKALLKETDIYRAGLPDLKIKTLYIGGGTPTCLTGGQLYVMLGSLYERLGIVKGTEVTVEGNPGTLDGHKLRIIKDSGCTRLSLGVQSFNQRELKMLGRIHSVNEVYDTVKNARAAGFDNLNIDLMYGLPEQEQKDWTDNLNKALELAPDHVSLYQLNYEEGTPFYSLLQQGIYQQFDQEKALNMYETAIETLIKSGYLHYEISNFSLPGKECKHNKIYWSNQEYLGLGAGASGYVAGIRYTNYKGLTEYGRVVREGEKPIESTEIITEDLCLREAVFLGLRLIEGINKSEFFLRYGVRLEDKYGETINKLSKKGLLQDTATHLALTRQGLYLANQVFIEFL